MVNQPLPLRGILAMTHLGVGSETVGNMLRKRLVLARLGIAGLSLGPGVLVAATV